MPIAAVAAVFLFRHLQHGIAVTHLRWNDLLSDRGAISLGTPQIKSFSVLTS